MAIATEFPVPPVPVEPKLRREYFTFLRGNRLASRLWRVGYPLVHYINARFVCHTPRHHRYLYYLQRALAKLARRDIKLPLVSHRLDGVLYCFCLNKRAEEYDAILTRCPVEQDTDALV